MNAFPYRNWTDVSNSQGFQISSSFYQLPQEHFAVSRAHVLSAYLSSGESDILHLIVLLFTA